jgi:peptidoglycan/xylan/chitin deacetylase (PgdA/CDA1 family)
MRRDQISDWLLEPRLPHHAPEWVLRALRCPAPRDPSALAEPVSLALTVDIEGRPRVADRLAGLDATRGFLQWLGTESDARGWRATVFVEGGLVEPLAPALRGLTRQHAIGLHGWAHELWGRPRWFLPHRPVAPAERRPLLRRGIDAFARAGLPRPRAFRAPYLACDDATLDLLAEAGFDLDSSGPAYRGCPPLVTHRGRLMRVPVSAAPRPRVRRRFGVPTWMTFDHLELPTVLSAPDDRLLEIVGLIQATQQRAGSPPHLVLLAHPWEFDDCGLPGCTVANRARLVERVGFLAAHLPVRYAHLAEVAGEQAVSAGDGTAGDRLRAALSDALRRLPTEPQAAQPRRGDWAAASADRALGRRRSVVADERPLVGASTPSRRSG